MTAYAAAATVCAAVPVGFGVGALLTLMMGWFR